MYEAGRGRKACLHWIYFLEVVSPYEHSIGVVLEEQEAECKGRITGCQLEKAQL